MVWSKANYKFYAQAFSPRLAISVFKPCSHLNVWCFRYHPDKTANDPVAADMFKEVTFSYNILSDPEKRRQYDSAGFEVRFVLHCGIVLDV